MSHEPQDSLYGAAFDELVCQYQGPEIEPYKAAQPLSGTSPGVLPLDPMQLPLVQLGPHAAGGTLRQRAALWLVSRTGIQTMATSLGVPTLVWGVAEVSAAHSLLYTGGTAGAAIGIGTALAMWSLDRGFGHKVTLTGAGIATVGVQVAMASAASPWSGFVGWLLSAAGCAALRVAYANGRREPEAKLRIMEGQARLMDARTLTEMHKAQAQAVKAQAQVFKSQLDQLKLQQALAAASAPPAAGPYLGGSTPEERALRAAFHAAFGEELERVSVESTMTGWSAAVALSVMSRKDALNGWDKVQSRLRAAGRFIVSEGRYTNELTVKFVDPSMFSTDPLTWHPGVIPADARHLMSLGIDTETGLPVEIQFDERLSVAGASGTGKSWAMRPLLAHAHLNGDLVLIDGKGEEGNIWSDVCRVAGEPEEILDIVDEVHAEMLDRKAQLKQRGLSVWDGDQLTVCVDEGQVVLSVLASVKDQGERLQKLVQLSSLGRSRGIVLWWCTQKPVMSGPAPGIHNLIAPNMLQRFCLRVADSTEAGTALDDCAKYGPQFIPADRRFRGHGYLKDYGPTLLRTWTLDDAAVRSLAPSIWHGSGAGSVPLHEEAAPTGGNRKLVELFIADNPGATHREIAEGTGVPAGSVGRLLRQIGG